MKGGIHNQRDATHTHAQAHTLRTFKNTQLLYAFYTDEGKGPVPSLPVNGLIVIIQKCDPLSMKMMIIKET